MELEPKVAIQGKQIERLTIAQNMQSHLISRLVRNSHSMISPRKGSIEFFKEEVKEEDTIKQT